MSTYSMQYQIVDRWIKNQVITHNSQSQHSLMELWSLFGVQTLMTADRLFKGTLTIFASVLL